MSHHVPSLPWTDEQWACVQSVVQEAARSARIASSFLPLVGPLPPGQASVPALAMGLTPPPRPWYATAADRLQIDDGATLRLTTIACEVHLSTQQAEDPDLASAQQMLRRAAVLVGRLEDAIIFNGQPLLNAYPMRPPAPGAPPGAPPTAIVQPEIYSLQGGDTYAGLLLSSAHPVITIDPAPMLGNNLVAGIVEAVGVLEGSGQYGPFACVLGDGLYEGANTPAPPSLVLPSDRFVPFLGGGPLLRSSTVPPDEGVVVALAGSPVDLVVATDVHVSYIQRSTEPRYVLRVSERFVLRVKQAEAICHLVPPNWAAAPVVAPPPPPGPPPPAPPPVVAPLPPPGPPPAAPPPNDSSE